ncbi:hypothetical protein KI688_000107 [Linnemannia hyalina]|uniref:Secreted protein n=1 Tax=Linnemannia hyalina TaxID=64524 RepID=A0A9P7Y572_9FUNG|nr:hypothetical protein KI688_000107 [Linnemannia hyalina]
MRLPAVTPSVTLSISSVALIVATQIESASMPATVPEIVSIAIALRPQADNDSVHSHQRRRREEATLTLHKHASMSDGPK